MSDYQIRKDIDQAKTFIDNLEYVLATEYGLTSNDIKELFDKYYDKSETYSKEEVNNLGNKWVEINLANGITLYRNAFLHLCELTVNVQLGTLNQGTFTLADVPSIYMPKGYVSTPIVGNTEVIVYCPRKLAESYVVKIKNYGSTLSDVWIRASLMWHY